MVRNCKLINSKIDFVVDLIVVYDNIQASVGVPLTGCSSFVIVRDDIKYRLHNLGWRVVNITNKQHYYYNSY